MPQWRWPKARFVSQRRKKRLGNMCEPSRAMTKTEKRCSHCGGKFGLICYRHWGLRFCRKACKDNFIAKAAKDYARLRKWFGFASPRASRSLAKRRH
jgi:hypothetical protein